MTTTTETPETCMSCCTCHPSWCGICDGLGCDACNDTGQCPECNPPHVPVSSVDYEDVDWVYTALTQSNDPTMVAYRVHALELAAIASDQDTSEEAQFQALTDIDTLSDDLMAHFQGITVQSIRVAMTRLTHPEAN